MSYVANLVKDTVRLSRQDIPASEGWRKLVEHVEGPFVMPESVTFEGNEAEVDNLNGLMLEHGGVTTLKGSDKHSTTLIIDFGRVAMGMVEIAVKHITGAPIRVSYAEFKQFLGPEGDGVELNIGSDARPWSRVDLFDPSDDSVVLKSPAKREVRYMALTLEGPGEVVIDFVRVRQTIYPVQYDGYFLSSDELLNRAWYSSAYTGDLSTLSEKSSLPGAPEKASPWMLIACVFDRVPFANDLHFQALAGYYQSSDYRWLVRNTLQQFGPTQNPDGSFPTSTSPLIKSKPGDPGPPDGWRWPEEGPDPDLAVGLIGGISVTYDMTMDSCTAFWVAALADYYMYSGDEEFVRPLLPVARRAIGFLNGRTTPDGLFYEPEDQRKNPKAKVKWVANWDPPTIASGVDSFTNAVYYDALKGLARLEEDIAGQQDAAKKLQEQAEQVRQALVKRFWDPTVGAMILNSEDPDRNHTLDANASNLMFRTLDDQRAREAIKFLDTKLATPFGTKGGEYKDHPYRWDIVYGLLNAIEVIGRVRYGDGKGAVESIRKTWGHMLRGDGPGTGWFAWNPDGVVERGAGQNVPWTSAIPALSEGVLGIRPTGPGYRRWEIAPQPSGLEWAQGRVPVPGGGISSRWKHTDEGFVLTIEAPQESRGTVVVPLLGMSRQIALDGKIVWQDGQPVDGIKAESGKDAVVFSDVQGAHTFAWATETRKDA